MELVSVIVTTKNEEKNISRALASIKAQTHKGIEIIVVDNSSGDSTIQIARKYTNKVFLRGPERSAQRNYGVKKARGNYILIIDADMWLSPGVVENCLKNIKGHKALIVPEKTKGSGFIANIRKFEREMYMGDPTIEVARFFRKSIFNEFSGYDLSLTGTEDYDLPKRIMDKYGHGSIGWASEWIFHHETQLTLPKLLAKRFYYASRSVGYAKKHPDLILTQGNMLLRPAYFRNWKRFVKHPFLAVGFIFVKSLEMIFAFFGFVKGVITSL